VHELLVAAANRTEGLLREPPPYVLQTALNDFHVGYEINAYTEDADRMPRTYTALHQNIQDEFQRAGVQIMSPNYEADPSAPKIPPVYMPRSAQPAG
jgi:small-conductance mechanosensitive channel